MYLRANDSLGGSGGGTEPPPIVYEAAAAAAGDGFDDGGTVGLLKLASTCLSWAIMAGYRSHKSKWRLNTHKKKKSNK